MVHTALFQLYIWYVVQLSVIIFLNNKINKKIQTFTCTKKLFFVPSRNYSHVHGNVLHANALQFLVL